MSFACLPALAQSQAIPAQQIEFFEKKVRPLLNDNCFKCHSAARKPVMGGLCLDTRAALLKGGDRGPSLLPGHPEKSLLITAIGYRDPKMQMPPRGRLKDDQIGVLTEWIRMGAPWPAGRPQATAGQPAKATFDLQARRAAHWAWRPVRRSPVPSVKNRAWPHNAIDYFLLAKLEADGLQPGQPADKLTLLRRVNYDLIGLPPTPSEIDAFLKDGSPDAYRKVVDRLLASPHYGERWARHWLDLVRYAETDGHEFDFDKPGVFRYRDYVIRAFNDDVPYNQFVKEQVAGDLLPYPRLHPTEKFNESVIGTGFWWLGEGKHSPVDITQDQRDTIDNQMDVFGKAFLGLTIGCAKCHDHKFDAISAKDYYALTGYLKSSRYNLANIDSPSHNRPIITELEKVGDQLAAMHSGPYPGKPRIIPGSAEVFEDFKKPGFEGWSVTGDAFGPGPRATAIAVKEKDGKAVIQRLATSDAADSGWCSYNLQGSLRSRTFTIDKPYVLFHLAGSGGAKVNLIIDGFQRIRYPIYGGLEIAPKDDSQMKWQAMEVSKWIGHEAYVEFLDLGPGRITCDLIAFSSSKEPHTEPFIGCVVLTSRFDGTSALASLLQKSNELKAKLVEPTRVLGLADGTGENDRVHLRGSHNTLGDEVPRRFLEACAGTNQPLVSGAGSGRLELAERMTSPSDTLLGRVLVNRLWQHHFGEGIVRSVDDFGVMGQPPTHPELLDWLASEFVRQGGSIKQMHRLMVMSSAYQMSSRANSVADRADPANKLLHRMPVRRLEAEAIRDAILAVSGRLDRTLFGPSVMPYLTQFMEGRGKPETSGPLDGAGRRSIYVGVRRNFLVPMFLAFDYPVPATCMGRRSVSNVPAQALTLMNNPFVIQQAEVWAKRINADKSRTAVQQIEDVYLTAFGRPPAPKETAAALRFLESQRKQYAGDELKPWADLSHVLFNVKEFIFVN